MKRILLILSCTLMLSSCMEDYSKGDRVGMLTQFSNTGVIFKSYEGQLNLTQTGMNSSGSEPFNFSVDRDNYSQEVINTLDSAMHNGWKIKIQYHETWGFKNILRNRGETDFFITTVEILDKNPINFKDFQPKDTLQ